MNKRLILIIGISAALLLSILFWLLYISTRPLPGTKSSADCSKFIDFSKLDAKSIEDKCRVHITEGTEVKYDNNPPTHGPHYADWVRAGVYPEPKDDRNLVHSLEHGYVILSYKCGSGSENEASTSAVIASGAKQSSQESNPTNLPAGKAGIATSPTAPRNDDKSTCDQRKKQLEAIYNKKGKHKLIVVARPNLDTNFALTTWDYSDKFNDFDEGRIIKFINAHLDNGPEKTMEP